MRERRHAFATGASSAPPPPAGDYGDIDPPTYTGHSAAIVAATATAPAVPQTAGGVPVTNNPYGGAVGSTLTTPTAGPTAPSSAGADSLCARECSCVRSDRTIFVLHWQAAPGKITPPQRRRIRSFPSPHVIPPNRRVHSGCACAGANTASGTAPPAPPTWTAVDATFRLMGNGLLPFSTANQAREFVVVLQ